MILTPGIVSAIVVCAVIILATAITLPLMLAQRERDKNQTQQVRKAHGAAMTAAASAAVTMGLPGISQAGKQRALQAVQAILDKTSDPGFPIDAVYTWVKGSDPKWWAQKAKVFEAFYGQPFKKNPRDPLEDAADRDELYYSVHLTAKFCPWMRRIWIFTAPGHRPDWMPPSGDMALGGVTVTVVHHDRVFDTKCITEPITFNSNVIESQLIHIARLAEHFVMFNDDFFVGAPMKRSDFFSKTGIPAVHLRNVTATLKTMSTMWGQHLRNMQSKVEALGSKEGLVPDHVAAPVRKSILAAVVKALKPEVCALRPFRTKNDFPSWYVALNIAPSNPRPPAVKSMYFASGPDFVRHMRGSRKGSSSNNSSTQGKWVAPHLFCINQEFSQEARQILQELLHQS